MDHRAFGHGDQITGIAVGRIRVGGHRNRAGPRRRHVAGRRERHAVVRRDRHPTQKRRGDGRLDHHVGIRAVGIQDDVAVDRRHPGSAGGDRDRVARHQADDAGRRVAVVRNVVVQLDNRNRVGLDNLDVAIDAAAVIVDIQARNRGLDRSTRTNTGDRVNHQTARRRNHINIGIAAVNYGGTRAQRHCRIAAARRDQTAQRDVLIRIKVDYSAAGIDHRAIGHRQGAARTAAADVEVGLNRYGRPAGTHVSTRTERHIVVRSQADRTVNRRHGIIYYQACTAIRR